VTTSGDFEALVSEAEAAPVEGWRFEWLEGRATEERPSWGYSRLVSERLSRSEAVLDIQTGGGEVFAEMLQRAARRPTRILATEGWRPNLAIARSNLAPLAGWVVFVPDDQQLPLATETFDLVICRHPTQTLWSEVARVLAPGGSFLSQQIGPGTNRELTEFFMGRQAVEKARRPDKALSAAEMTGLLVTDLREETLTVTFNDVGAVVYFLRKVVWTVPDFSVERYRERLGKLHAQIQRYGPFVSHATRFLIEARKPAPDNAEAGDSSPSRPTVESPLTATSTQFFRGERQRTQSRSQPRIAIWLPPAAPTSPALDRRMSSRMAESNPRSTLRTQRSVRAGTRHSGHSGGQRAEPAWLREQRFGWASSPGPASFRQDATTPGLLSSSHI
jgi:SAM-dependent methyltransferase